MLACAALNWNSEIWKWKGETSNLISTEIGSFSYWTNYALFFAYKLITSLHPNAFRLYARRRERCKWIMHSTRMMMLLLLLVCSLRTSIFEVNEYTMILSVFHSDCRVIILLKSYLHRITSAKPGSGYAHRANNNALETMARLARIA